MTLDISPYLYRLASGAPATAAVRDLVREEILDGRKMAFLKVRPIQVGSALQLSANREVELEINLDKFRVAQSYIGNAIASRTLAAGNSVQELSSRLSAGHIAVPVNAMPETGCAQIAFSIFDATGTRPMDHLVYSVPIAADASTQVTQNDCPVPRVQGGFSSLAGAIDAPAGNVAAALHIFQYRGVSGPTSTAIYVDIPKYRAAPKDAPLAARGVYWWSLQSDLAEYIGKDLQPLVNAARRSNDYSGVARELERKVFPSSASDKTEGGAKSAVGSLRAILSGKKMAPTLLVRATTAEGTPIYAPLGLLSLARQSNQRLQVVYPLPRQDYSGKNCIKEWAVGYPNELEGALPTERLELSATELIAGRMTRLSDKSDLESYLDPEEQPSSGNGSGEALLLLAHHGGGYFWFKGQGQDSNRISVEQNNRVFPRGSVAFLNVCSAANPTGNNQAVVERFNKNGVDAMVVSPFPVDVQYGSALSLAAIRYVKSSYQNGATPTLAQIFDKAAAGASTLLPNKKLENRAFEYLLLGNSELRLCKQ